MFFVNKNLFGIKWLKMSHSTVADYFSSEQDFVQSITTGYKNHHDCRFNSETCIHKIKQKMAKEETKIGTVRYQYALMAMLVTTGKIYSYFYKKGWKLASFQRSRNRKRYPKPK